MGFLSLDLQPGETLLMSGLANKWQRIGSKGGKLFLTDRRIVFKAHILNFGSKYEEYALSEIQTKGNTVNIKTTSNLGLSFNITFETKSGEKLSFVIGRAHKDEWIKQITEAIANWTRKNISMPENIPAEAVQEIFSQIKVHQCEGCGAFVVLTHGKVSVCDYCGRPATY